MKVTITIEDTLRGTIKIVSTPNYEQIAHRIKDGQASPAHEMAALTLNHIWKTLQGAKVVRVKQPNNLE